MSPRFGIKQGKKTRPIDNLTASGVNAQVETVDEIASMVKRAMQELGQGAVLVGRTYDLQKAYRQLAIAPGHLRFAWIAVWSPEHEAVRLFQMKALPFGGTGSVAAFLRVSRALKEIGVRSLRLMWTSFYDDFVVVCREGEAEHTDRLVRFFFETFGWRLSTDDEKNCQFSKIFDALGVQFDLRDAPKGVLRIGNTDKRKAELGQLVQDILRQNRLPPKEAESLRSRLMFAESQVYGRTAKVALRHIGQPGLDAKVMEPLSRDVRFSLEWMRRRIVNGPPREVLAKQDYTFHLFVDGACEPTSAARDEFVTSIGAVLIGPNGKGIHFFGLELPACVTRAWCGGKRRQLIFEAEVLPYVLSLALWSDILRGRFLIVYIDNDAARHSWITCTARNLFVQRMLHRGALMETDLSIHSYFARVPTASNVGDGPSRSDFGLCEALGATRCAVEEQLVVQCALEDPLANV